MPPRLWITPACAGKTRHALIECFYPRDHPRVCGENSFERRQTLLYRGSPPRVRGKPCKMFGITYPLGITPACAGKTLSGIRNDRFCGDHPRVCGENPLVNDVREAVMGSPPRVRGKLLTSAFGWLIVGITPACAGKTCQVWLMPAAHRDHPRVCGENGTFARQSNVSELDHPRVCGENPYPKDLERYSTGSPPRVRGKQ